MPRSVTRGSVTRCLFLLTALLPTHGNHFLDSFIQTCTHTFPDGSFYDLSPLARTPGRDDYVAEDENGHMFYLNVCNNVQQIPKECRTLGKLMRSPGYEVKNDSECYWLGDLERVEWSHIDDTDPRMGVELQYYHGEQCAPGAFRQLRFRLYCDPTSQMGDVAEYSVEHFPELCLSLVTFPSLHGCPVAGHVSSGWSFVIFYHVYQDNQRFGWEALPNRRFWQSLPDLVKDGIVFAADVVTGRADWAATGAPRGGVPASQASFSKMEQFEWGPNSSDQL